MKVENVTTFFSTRGDNETGSSDEGGSAKAHHVAPRVRQDDSSLLITKVYRI
jgi:hypothetical protein